MHQPRGWCPTWVPVALLCLCQVYCDSFSNSYSILIDSYVDNWQNRYQKANIKISDDYIPTIPNYSFSHIDAFSVGSYICLVILAFIFSCFKGTTKQFSALQYRLMIVCFFENIKTFQNINTDIFQEKKTAENIFQTFSFQSRIGAIHKTGKSV